MEDQQLGQVRDGGPGTRPQVAQDDRDFLLDEGLLRPVEKLLFQGLDQ